MNEERKRWSRRCPLADSPQPVLSILPTPNSHNICNKSAPSAGPIYHPISFRTNYYSKKIGTGKSNLPDTPEKHSHALFRWHQRVRELETRSGTYVLEFDTSIGTLYVFGWGVLGGGVNKRQ